MQESIAIIMESECTIESMIQYLHYRKGLNIASGTQAAATVGYAMIFTCFLYPGKIEHRQNA